MSEDAFVLRVKGLEVESDSRGVRAAKPFRFAIPDDFVKGPWTAQWIWLAPEKHPALQETCLQGGNIGPKNYAVVAFQHDFEAGPEDTETWMRISADRKYRLFINGTLAARGPAEPGGDIDLEKPVNWWFFDSVDISSLVKPGLNRICVEVCLFTNIYSDFSCGHGGLILEASSLRHGEWRQLLATDASWPCSIQRAFVAPNRYDARLEDAQGWETSVLVADSSIWHLIPSTLPQMMEHEIEAKACPGDVLVADGATATVDFGRVFAGFMTLDLEAPAGAELKIEYAEAPDSEGFHRTEFYVSKGGRQRFRAFNLASIRILAFSATGGAFKLRRPRAVFSSYPLAWRGSFSCSDAELDKFWEFGRHATQICMQAFHLDSPLHQEPSGDTGDYLIEADVNYICFGETALAAADIDRTARLLRQRGFRMFHTSYSLFWTIMLQELYMRTGDLELLRRHKPEVEGLIEKFLSWRGSNGLVTECPSFMFMDFLSLDGFELHHPPCVIGQGYMSAFLHWAMRAALFMANELGEDAWAGRLDRASAELRDAFKKALWNPSRQLFRDGIPFVRKAPTGGLFMPADRVIETFTRHTNIAAVVAGIVSGAEARGLMRRVMDDPSLMEPQPFFHQFTFRALEMTGLFQDYGFPLLKSWGRMLSGDMTTWRETWHWGDLSHAAASSPTLQLSRNVLGLKIIKPGGSILELSPCLGPLDFAEGTIPLPQGDAHVRLERHADCLDISLDLPSGCSVLLPETAPGHLPRTVRTNHVRHFQLAGV